jgi:hypothetical protein
MQTNSSMTLSGSRRTNVVILGVMLVVVATTVSLLIWQRSATLRSAQLSTDTPAGLVLDQHERHPAGVPTDLYAPRDQHERHPRLFGAFSGSETGARDRWWADRKEDDAKTARDAWWLEK